MNFEGWIVFGLMVLTMGAAVSPIIVAYVLDWLRDVQRAHLRRVAPRMATKDCTCALCEAHRDAAARGLVPLHEVTAEGESADGADLTV